MNFIVVREVLHNNYQSHNLIGPYHFWAISPRNSTSFTRSFLTRRCKQAGHKTKTAVTRPFLALQSHSSRVFVTIVIIRNVALVKQIPNSELPNASRGYILDPSAGGWGFSNKLTFIYKRCHLKKFLVTEYSALFQQERIRTGG